MANKDPSLLQAEGGDGLEMFSGGDDFPEKKNIKDFFIRENITEFI